MGVEQLLGMTQFRENLREDSTRSLYLRARVGSSEIGIPLHEVQEVTPLGSPNFLPTEQNRPRQEFIKLRETVVSIYRLDSVLSLTYDQEVDQKLAVIFKMDEQLCGIVVDDILEVTSIEEQQVQTLKGGVHELVKGPARVAKMDKGELPLISLEATINNFFKVGV